MSTSRALVVVFVCISAISSLPQYQYSAQGPYQTGFNFQAGPYPQQQPYPYQQQGGGQRGGRYIAQPPSAPRQDQQPSIFGSAPSSITSQGDNGIPGSGQTAPSQKSSTRYPLTPPVLKFRIGVISDLDKLAKETKVGRDGKEEATWVSYLNEGNLYVQQNKDDPEKSNITVEWDEDRIHTIHTSLNWAGRGNELSTLNVFNGHLYSCDDKTGVIYELPISDSLEIVPNPWVIIADGNFTGPNGFKCEWATVKDGELWVGGHGKDAEHDGNITKKEKWVKRITPEGAVTYLDWNKNFDKMAEALDIHFPGYVTHEAAGWSDTLRKWIFMPRKISKEKFDDSEDEKKGSNAILLADEDFGNVQVGHVGDLIPTHGFASFKFVPGTGDQMIVAIKSVESDDKTETYIMAFDLKGNVLLPETKFADKKYEGVEFI